MATIILTYVVIVGLIVNYSVPALMLYLVFGDDDDGCEYTIEIVSQQDIE